MLQEKSEDIAVVCEVDSYTFDQVLKETGEHITYMLVHMYTMKYTFNI